MTATVGPIRAALETHLLLVPNAPDIIIFDNLAVEPPTDGSLHLDCSVLRADPRSPTLGANELTEENGIFQVSVRSAPNRGSGEVEAYADVVKDHFPKGMSLTAGGVTVTILRRGSVTPARPDGGWTRSIVSIPYFAYVFHS